MKPFLSIEGIWVLTAAALEQADTWRVLDAEKVLWLENPVRGRIEGLNFRGFVTRGVSCDIECVSEASSAVKGAVTSRSLSQPRGAQSRLPPLPLVQIGYGHQGAQASWESLAGSSGFTEVKRPET